MRVGGFLGSLPLALSEGHVPGDPEEQDPAGDAQGVQGNTQVVEQWTACCREEHESHSRHYHGLAGYPSGITTGMVAHERDEDRGKPRWIHNHQESQ